MKCSSFWKKSKRECWKYSSVINSDRQPLTWNVSSIYISTNAAWPPCFPAYYFNFVVLSPHHLCYFSHTCMLTFTYNLPFIDIIISFWTLPKSAKVLCKFLNLLKLPRYRMFQGKHMHIKWRGRSCLPGFCSEQRKDSAVVLFTKIHSSLWHFLISVVVRHQSIRIPSTHELQCH